MMNQKVVMLTVMASLVGTGCTAQHHARDVRATDEDVRVTVGTVQREVRLGMAATDVAAVLGSPNIVTSDGDRRETWIYDKISTDVSRSESNGSLIGLIFGGSGGAAGLGSKAAGARSTSQRTLTVIIKFDENDRVRDFSYHSSRF